MQKTSRDPIFAYAVTVQKKDMIHDCASFLAGVLPGESETRPFGHDNSHDWHVQHNCMNDEGIVEEEIRKSDGCNWVLVTEELVEELLESDPKISFYGKLHDVTLGNAR